MAEHPYAELVGPLQDQFAQQFLAGIEHGFARKRAAEGATRQIAEANAGRAFSSAEAEKQRQMQIATATLGAQQGLARAGQEPGSLPPQYAPLQGPMTQFAGDQMRRANEAEIRAMQPTMLPPASDVIYGGAMAQVAQQPGGMGPPDLRPQSNIERLTRAMSEAQLGAVQQARPALPPPEQQSLAPYAPVQFTPEPKPTRDYMAEIALKNAGQLAAVRARPRPVGRGGTEADDLALANKNASTEATQIEKFKQGALNRIYGKDLGMRPDPADVEAQSAIEIDGYRAKFADDPSVQAAIESAGPGATATKIATILFNSPTTLPLQKHIKLINEGRGNVNREGEGRPTIPKGAPRAPTSGPGSAAEGNPIRNFMLQHPDKYGDPQQYRAILADPNETPARKAWARQSYADAYEKARAELAAQQGQ